MCFPSKILTYTLERSSQIPQRRIWAHYPCKRLSKQVHVIEHFYSFIIRYSAYVNLMSKDEERPVSINGKKFSFSVHLHYYFHRGCDFSSTCICCVTILVLNFRFGIRRVLIEPQPDISMRPLFGVTSFL